MISCWHSGLYGIAFTRVDEERGGKMSDWANLYSQSIPGANVHKLLLDFTMLCE